MEPLAHQSNKFASYRGALAGAYAGRAKLRLMAAQWPQAIADSERAISIFKGLIGSAPDNPDFLGELALVNETRAEIAWDQQNKNDARQFLKAAISLFERSLTIDRDRNADIEKLAKLQKRLSEMGH